jgi:predicted transcriptional regulator
MYPGIDHWFRNKVMPGLKTGERIAYLGLDNDRPVASAVLKNGADAKFCHLHIDPSARDIHLGEIFFSMMAMDAKRHARNIHFTLPESLWETEKGFFQSFGFLDAVRAGRQYRHHEPEFRCRAPFETVWRHAREKFVKIVNGFADTEDNPFKGVVMSVRPRFAQRIASGEKTVEVRRKFHKKWEGRQAVLYSSSPDQAILGRASIQRTVFGPPADIWREFGPRIGATEKEFHVYIQQCDELCAIVLGDFQPYTNPITLQQLGLYLEKEPRPPQSYQEIERNADWTEALFVVELLHRRFRMRPATFGVFSAKQTDTTARPSMVAG